MLMQHPVYPQKDVDREHIHKFLQQGWTMADAADKIISDIQKSDIIVTKKRGRPFKHDD
jgi:hypothetical protein